MIEFIDKTNEQDGTPISRENLMAMQGFIGTEIIFKDDSSIEEKNSKSETLTTTRNSDGSITQIFSGKKIIKKTIYLSNIGIKEVIE